MYRQVFVLAVSLLCVPGTRIEGDKCNFDDGTEGECRTVADCLGTSEKMLRGIEPKLCSNVQREPIVCCNSKTERMCQEYGQYVYWESQSPVLDPVQKRVNESTCAMSGQTLIGAVKANPGEFPHMAALGFGNESNIAWRCSGSLISERYILTVAHCLYAPDRSLVLWARLGDLNYNKVSDDDADAVTIAISERTIHPDYKRSAYYHDIALVKLVEDVTFSRYIRPACLYTRAGHSTLNSTVSGWGKLSFDTEYSHDLIKVDYTLKPAIRCNTTYYDLIRAGNKLKEGIDPDTMICAGDHPRENYTCGGNSGSPLQFRQTKPHCMYSIIGIMSFGLIACGMGDNPDVFTRVSHYVPWIEGIVWP